MKLTVNQLRSIIKEEVQHVLSEGSDEDQWLKYSEIVEEVLKQTERLKFNVSHDIKKDFSEKTKLNINEAIDRVVNTMTTLNAAVKRYNASKK